MADPEPPARRGIFEEGRRLFRSVDWSLSYVAFLLFVFIILTYRIPGGSVAIGVAAAGLLFERRGLRVPAPLVIFAGFIAWSAGGIYHGVFPGLTSEEVIAFVQLWVIMFVAVNVLTSGPRLKFFLVYFLALFLTHPARGAYFNGFLYGHTTADRFVWRDSFGNPNDLAALSFLPLGIALGFLSDENPRVRWAAGTSILALTFLIFLTQSRGGIIALALFGTLALLAHRRRLRSMALVACLGLVMLVAFPTGAADRMSDLVTTTREGDVRDADSSAEQRLQIWEVATHIIRDHPVTGVGLGAYREVHSLTTEGVADWELAGGARDVHSTYLGVLAETGWPGFVLFIGILAAVFRQSVRARGKLGAGTAAMHLRGLEAALIALLVAGIFGTFFGLTLFYLQLALVISFAELVNRQPGHATDDQAIHRPVGRVASHLSLSGMGSRGTSRSYRDGAPGHRRWADR